MVLEWEEPTKDVTDTARREHWVSKCGKFKVTHSVSLFGLGERAYSQVRKNGRYDLIRLHEDQWASVNAAFRQCETYPTKEKTS